MFGGRSNKTMIGATLTTLSLIHTLTVHNLRKNNRSPIWGLVQTTFQAMMMVLFFIAMYSFMGQRRTPIGNDFLLFMMSGVFLYLTHSQTVMSVNSGNAMNALNQHEPINPAIIICSGALSTLYTQTISLFMMLFVYTELVQPVHIDQPARAFGMLLFAWFSGICVGLVLLAARPWWPKGVHIIQLIYQRGNLIASGKMFAGNSLPAMVLPYFDWNPLFHIIDQNRGYVYFEYTPRNSSLEYPAMICLILLGVGLMGEFVTRRSESASWSAGK